MIDKKFLITHVEQFLEGSDNYLIDVIINPGNIISIEIDNNNGVNIDDCVELSRFLESNLSRDVEDYELEVGSAGIGQPFKVLQQYINHVGHEVEVLPNSGTKIKGILKSADENGFVLQAKQKQVVEGSKRAKMVEVELPFKYSEIKYTKYVISLKQDG